MKVLNSLVLGAFLVGTLGFADSASADSWKRRKAERWDRRYDARTYDQCRPIVERMAKSRRYIREWDRTGRHEKAVRWHKEDIVKQQRALRDCERRVRHDRHDRDYDYGRWNDDRWDSSYDRYDDRYDDRYGSYDPYYDNYDSGVYGGVQSDALGAILGSLLGTR